MVEGQNENGGGPVFDFAFEENLATVGIRDALAEAESQTKATRLARTGFIHPVKRIEDFTELFGGDPHALVPHFETHAIALRGHRQRHIFIAGRVLERVLDQVAQYALNLFAVDFGDHRFRAGREPKTLVYPTPEESIAQMKVPEGFEVQLFVSEKDFPEFANPYIIVPLQESE